MNKKSILLTATFLILTGLVLLGAGCSNQPVEPEPVEEEEEEVEITEESILNYCSNPDSFAEFKNNLGGTANFEDCVEILTSSFFSKDGYREGYMELVRGKCDEASLTAEDPEEYKGACYSFVESLYEDMVKKTIEDAEKAILGN